MSSKRRKVVSDMLRNYELESKFRFLLHILFVCRVYFDLYCRVIQYYYRIPSNHFTAKLYLTVTENNGLYYLMLQGLNFFRFHSTPCIHFSLGIKDGLVMGNGLLWCQSLIGIPRI